MTIRDDLDFRRAPACAMVALQCLQQALVEEPCRLLGGTGLFENISDI